MAWLPKRPGFLFQEEKPEEGQPIGRSDSPHRSRPTEDRQLHPRVQRPLGSSRRSSHSSHPQLRQSRDKRVGDFGVGWTLGIKNVRLEKSGNLGKLWDETFTPGILPKYCLEPTRPKTVTITFPDGRQFKFITDARSSKPWLRLDKRPSLDQERKESRGAQLQSRQPRARFSKNLPLFHLGKDRISNRRHYKRQQQT